MSKQIRAVMFGVFLLGMVAGLWLGLLVNDCTK
jgi:hypothetical protein